MSDGPIFTSLDASKLEASFLKLLCRTAREKGRVELTNCDGGTCILISKEELDSLERALEILSGTDGAERMRRHIQDCAVCALVAE